MKIKNLNTINIKFILDKLLINKKEGDVDNYLYIYHTK